MEKQGLCFLILKAEAIEDFIAGVLFVLGIKRAMGLGAASIYFTDPRQKVESGFGLRNNSFLDALISDVLLTAVLLGLGINRGP